MILRRGFQFTPGYRLQEYIGKGQFGEVWRASGPGGVTLAVKFIDLTDGSGQKEYAAIKRIKSIRQANLMQITAIWQLDEEGQVLPEPPDETEQTIDLFDLDSRGGSGFVVNPGPKASTLVVGMLLGDTSLESFLPRKQGKDDQSGHTGVPPGDLLRYMEGVARGLDFLNAPKHDFGAGPVSLQHCDIKPANIVLIGDSAVICDFGLARILQRNQATLTQAAGTPAYMSPEAIDGKPSCNSDQYSLAVTYYHLRTGTLPVRDGSVYQVLNAHRSGELDFDLVPSAERAILMRATHMNWQERFPSNTAFVDAIRIILTEQQLHEIGDGAGPSGKHVVEAAPRSGADGPAVAGIETMPSKDLTDGFVKHSKGGSPILSDHPEFSGPAKADQQSGSTATTEHPDRSSSGSREPKKGTVEFASIPLDGLPQAPQWTTDQESEGVNDDTATGTRPSSGKLALLAGGAALAVVLLGIAWNRSGGNAQKSPLDNSSTPADELQNTFALLATDRQAAQRKYQSLVQTDPGLRTPVLSLAKGRHQGAIEAMVAIGSPPRFATTGYDQSPKLWSADKAGEWSAIDLTALSSAVYYREAVLLTPDQQWLLFGAGSTLHAIRIDKVTASDRAAFPLKADLQIDLQDDVISLTSHPRQPQQVLVGLADQTMLVVDLTLANQDEAIVAKTELTDVASQCRFTSSGDMVIVRREIGDLVALDWNALIENDAESSAVPEIQTGISNVRDVWGERWPQQQTNTKTVDWFWVGDDEGVVAGYKLADATNANASGTERVVRWFVDDDAHQRGITALKFAQTGSSGWVLASGDDDGQLGVFQFAEALDESVAAFQSSDEALQASNTAVAQLEDGPIRCIEISASGSWLVAGAEHAVWVIDLASPVKNYARIPVGNVAVDSLAIDETHNQLLVGCSDGRLGVLNWSHCRLRTSVRPIRDQEEESIEPAPDPPPPGRVTQNRSSILPSLGEPS